MNRKEILNKMTPHLIAIGAFLLLLFFYFSPVYFKDQSLPQNDVIQAQGAAKEVKDYREKTGEEALWTGSMFSGMPIYIINVSYSGDWVHKLQKMIRFLKSPGDVLFIGFISFYILLCSLRVGPALSFAGAFSYTFATFSLVSIEAGHVFKLLAIGYMPLVIAGLILVYRKKLVLGGLIYMVGMALEINSKHPQITYYLLILSVFMVAHFLIKAIKEKELVVFAKGTGILAILTIVAIGPAIPFLWSSMEYNKYSTRGGSELTKLSPQEIKYNLSQGLDTTINKTKGLDKEYVFDYSSGKFESMTMLVPNLYGGASGMELSEEAEYYSLLQKYRVPIYDKNRDGRLIKVPTYWGPQQDKGTAGPIFVGSIIFFLFILGMFVVKSNMKWWIFGAAVFFAMLSWGKNFVGFNGFMFDHVPLYDKFRAVSMAAIGATLCLPFLGLLALREVFSSDDKNHLFKSLKWSGLSMLGLFALMIYFYIDSSFYGPAEIGSQSPALGALKADRSSLLIKDIFRSFTFIGIAFLLIFVYLKGLLSKSIAIYGLVGLMVIDIWTVDKRYLNDSNFVDNYQSSLVRVPATSKAILDTEKKLGNESWKYRVYDRNNPFNNARTSYFHHSVGGYHGAKMARYQDLIKWYLSYEHDGVLDMLNTKYFIGHYVMGEDKQRKLVQSVTPRKSAYGNAWFVSSVKKVNNPNEEIESLRSTDLKNTVIIDKTNFKTKKDSYDPNGSIISLDKYEPNHLTYNLNAKNDGFVVFSEIYYPLGWNAYIDGNPADYQRVNYVLRGMDVPKGKHKIEFKFEPSSYHTGNRIALFGSIIFTLILIAGCYFLLKPKIKSNNQPQV